MPPDARFCVAEIGMNHAGEIAPLARLARPHVAVITAVEKAHIGYLGSIEAIADEKAAILRALEPGGVAVLPADTPLLPRLRAAAAGARGRDLRRRRRGAECGWSTRDGCGRQRCRRATIGSGIGPVPAERAGPPHGDERARRACRRRSICRRAARAHRARALEGFAPVAGRGARRQIAVPGGTALLLDESYNGNPASMRAALAVLRLQPARTPHRRARRHAGTRRRQVRPNIARWPPTSPRRPIVCSPAAR